MNYIYAHFPREKFALAIETAIASAAPHHKQIDILQTFAPNLHDYSEHLIRALDRDLQVRILLAWPYSQAAKLRENVLRRCANRSIGDEIDIRDRTIANLETLELQKLISSEVVYFDHAIHLNTDNQVIYYP